MPGMDHATEAIGSGRRSASPRLRTAALVIPGAIVVAIGAVLPFVSPLPRDEVVTPASQAALASSSGLWLASAAVAERRDPAGPMWRLLIAMTIGLWIWSIGYLATPLALTISYAIAPLSTAIFVHVLVAFPSGRVRAGRDQSVIAATYAFTLASGALRMATLPGDWNLLFLTDDPVAVEASRWASLGVPILGSVVAWVLIGHWRAAMPVGRRVLLPVLVALPIAFVLESAGYVGDAFGWTTVSDATRSPIAIALGATVPLGILLGLARSRLDRGRVADLLVELGRGVPIGGLRDLLARTLRDPSLRLAFTAPGVSGLVDGDGRPVEIPDDASRRVVRLDAEGQTLAVLIHDPALDSEDPALLAAVGSAARLALDNERLTAEVRARLAEVSASRARIVEAADEERRRVERDLHDGAQQRLVALALRLDAARGPDGTDPVLERATAELREAIAELRGLARGIHPTILTESGLQAAIESLAERSPIPVDVQVTPARFAGPVEATAYFVASEGLTNVARSSHATSASVSAEVDVTDRRLIIRVADDGVGGADPSLGSGLRGLADRVAAAGGTFAVESPVGGGTVLRAELPLR